MVVNWPWAVNIHPLDDFDRLFYIIAYFGLSLQKGDDFIELDSTTIVNVKLLKKFRYFLYLFLGNIFENCQSLYMAE